MKVTVYTLPVCQQCNMTKRWLDQRGIEYSTVDLSTDAQAAEAVKFLGYLAAPVIVVSNGDPETDLHWSGFHPANLSRYCTAAAA